MGSYGLAETVAVVLLLVPAAVLAVGLAVAWRAARPWLRK